MVYHRLQSSLVYLAETVFLPSCGFLYGILTFMNIKMIMLMNVKLPYVRIVYYCVYV